MKPGILIVAGDGFDKNRPYFMINLHYGNAVARAGGLPIVGVHENCLDEYADLCDGLLLVDGPLLHVGSYGDYYRTTTDYPAISRQREILELSLFEGMMARQKPVLGINRGMHLINVALGGSLCEVEGMQKIDRLANGLTVTSRTREGDVQSFRHEELAIFGVYGDPTALNDRIFDQFIKGIAI